MVRQQNLKGGLTRREILRYGLYGGLAAGLAPSLWLSGCGKRLQVKRPNIILVVIDTLRADHVGCYGYQRNTTSNNDPLARDGEVIKNAISAAPWTMASIASLLTSQYPCVLGLRKQPAMLDSRFPMLSEVLKQYDYTTYGVFTAASLSPRLGVSRGFDDYRYRKKPRRGAVISSPYVTKEAISFLGKSQKEPFFLFLHYFDPHYNYILHKQYDYSPPYHGSVESNHSMLDLWHKLHELSEDDIRYLLALYDSEIAFTDEYIGKLLDELKKQGLYEDSIIIVTADHGEEFLERGWLGHTITLHEEMMHVPLIMKLPGYGARVIDSPVGLIDIVPTIYQYMGLKMPDGLEGKALDLNRGDSIANRPIFTETFNPQRARPNVRPIAFRSIISGNWKLIYDQIKNSNQVYNLSEDPHERNDLSGQRSEQKRVLKGLLSKWINYVKTKQKVGPVPDESELFTPEERKELESLGYL